MIFVTVGTQLAFDRMVAAVDAWAGQSGAKVFAQIGPGAYRPAHMQYAEFLEPADFDRQFSEASLVIAHAGMGSILTALSYGKPLIIMPRRADMGEHRNDHQMATAGKFRENPAVHIAWDEIELASLLKQYQVILQKSGQAISSHAPDAFIARLRHLIES